MFNSQIWIEAIQETERKGSSQDLEQVIAEAIKISGLRKSVESIMEGTVEDVISGKTDDFSVFYPTSVETVEKAGANGEKRWGVQGYCSTEDIDRQGETLIQKGLDFEDFIKFGFFNDNHQQHTAAVVGIPEVARLDEGKGWWNEGYLLPEVKRAQEIWTLAKALKGTKRQLGFSVEGKVILRDPMQNNKILKAKIRNVAITNSPINTNAVANFVAKSLLARAFADQTADTAKALMAGSATTPVTGGDVSRPQSVETTLRDMGFAHADVGEMGEIIKVFQCGKCRKGFFTDNALNVHIRRIHRPSPNTIVRDTDLDKSEAVQYIKNMRPEYSVETCKKIVDLLMREE